MSEKIEMKSRWWRSFVYPEWVEENEIRGYAPHVVYAVAGEEDSKSNQPRRATAKDQV